jgi:hypothetical protein
MFVYTLILVVTFGTGGAFIEKVDFTSLSQPEALEMCRRAQSEFQTGFFRSACVRTK